MAGYSIEIGEGSQKYTLNVNFKFDIRGVLSLADAGAADKREIFIQASGKFTGNQAAVASSAVALSEEITSKVTPRRVQIFEDGTSKWDFKASDSIASPIVTEFNITSEEDGSGESYWKWSLSIYVLQFARNAEPNNVIELRTSLQIITNVQGEVVRKVWRASAKGKDADAAEAAVLTYKPAGERITQDLTTFAQEARAVGVWVWEAEKKKDIISIKESFSGFGGGIDYSTSTVIGAPGKDPPDPVAHLKPREPIILTIDGEILGYKRDKLKPPPEHFSAVGAGGLRRRLTGRERRSEVTLHDHEKGIYRLTYQEVWLFTQKNMPKPNHHDHKDSVILQPPEDGKIANK